MAYSVALVLCLALTSSLAAIHGSYDSNKIDQGDEKTRDSPLPDWHCSDKFVGLAMRACDVVTDEAEVAFLSCVRELDLTLPCIFKSWLHTDTVRTCPNDESEIDTWDRFLNQSESRCLMRCFFNKMGLMKEDNHVSMVRWYKYVEKHYTMTGRFTAKESNEFLSCMRGDDGSDDSGESDDDSADTSSSEEDRYTMQRPADCVETEKAEICSFSLLMNKLEECVGPVCRKLLVGSKGMYKSASQLKDFSE